jgi:hypothetical protein
MSYRSIPKTGRAPSVCLALAVVAFGSLFVSSAQAQYSPTTWTITVDGTGPRTKPGYTVTYMPVTGGCPYATAAADAERLKVCQGDTVNWIANTSTTKNVMSVIHEDPVMDQNHVPTQGFSASDSSPVGAVVDSNAAFLGPHEYFVVVFDKNTRRSYVDDPKIMIGTGSAIEIMKELLDSIEPQAIQLRALVDESRLGKDAREQAKQIVDAVQALKKNPGLR